MQSIGHRSLTLAVLLVMKVFEWVLKFSGNSAHPEVTLMNSTIHTLNGVFIHDLDGEIGNTSPLIAAIPGSSLLATTDLLNAVTFNSSDVQVRSPMV